MTEITAEMREAVIEVMKEIFSEFLFGGEKPVLLDEEVPENLSDYLEIEVEGMDMGYARILGIYKSISKSTPRIAVPYTNLDPSKYPHMLIEMIGIDQTKVIFGVEVDGEMTEEVFGTDISDSELGVVSRGVAEYPKPAKYRTEGEHRVRFRIGYSTNPDKKNTDFFWFAKSREFLVNIVKVRE